MPSHLGSRSSPLRPERGGDRPSVTRGRRAVRVSPELRHPSPRDKSAREPEVLCVPGRPNNRMAQCPLARRPTRQTPSNTPRRLQLQGPNAARRKTPSPAAECTPYIMSRLQRLRKSSKSLSRKKKKGERASWQYRLHSQTRLSTRRSVAVNHKRALLLLNEHTHPLTHTHKTQNNNAIPPRCIRPRRQTRPGAQAEERRRSSLPPADAPPQPVRQARRRVLHLLGHLLRPFLHPLVPGVLPRGRAVRLDRLLAGRRHRRHPLVVARLRVGLLGGRRVLGVCACGWSELWVRGGDAGGGVVVVMSR